MKLDSKFEVLESPFNSWVMWELDVATNLSLARRKVFGQVSLLVPAVAEVPVVLVGDARALRADPRHAVETGMDVAGVGDDANLTHNCVTHDAILRITYQRSHKCAIRGRIFSRYDLFTNYTRCVRDSHKSLFSLPSWSLFLARWQVWLKIQTLIPFEISFHC